MTDIFNLSLIDLVLAAIGVSIAVWSVALVYILRRREGMRRSEDLKNVLIGASQEVRQQRRYSTLSKTKTI